MFNSEYREKTVKNLKKAIEEYEKSCDIVLNSVQLLHDDRSRASSLIKKIEDEIINVIAHTPKEFTKYTKEIRINYRDFNNKIREIEDEISDLDVNQEKVIFGGVLTGAGVATLGPQVVIGIATTFGTASTGTAISALTGAAATKAALAWLGGGAISVGGGGVLAGKTLLGMTGPVGWVIGGLSLVAGGIFVNNKNKEIAEKAENDTYKLKEEKNKLDILNVKVKVLIKETEEICLKIRKIYRKFMFLDVSDYYEFTNSEKADLKKLINLMLALSKKINETVE